MRYERGISILEIVVALAIIGILTSVAVSAVNIRGLNNDLQNSTRELAGHFKQIRAKAMVTTSAYRLVADDTAVIKTLKASWASNCGATVWTDDASFDIELREGVTFSGLTANQRIICFNSRGLADTNPTVTITKDGKTEQIEVFLGGGVEVK